MSIMIGGKPKNTSTPVKNKEVSSKEDASLNIKAEESSKKTRAKKTKKEE